MKNYWLPSLSLFSLALLLCTIPTSAMAQKKKKKKTPAKTAQTGTWVVPAPGVRDKAALDAQKQQADKLKKASMPWAVSFISIGEGIDLKAEKKFLELHQSFTMNGCELFLDKTAKGREGERDYCVSSANSDCMIKFREAVDKMIAGNRLILILDEQPCK
jgi:hypothetical protein